MNIARILANDDIREELEAKLDLEMGFHNRQVKPLNHERPGSQFEIWAAEGAPSKELEAIVRQLGRPVLFIRQNTVAEPESELWKARIDAARSNLEAVLPSIGRIEVRNHPDKQWLGTGWLVTPEVLVTSRHVAAEFGRRGDGGFVFKRNPAGKVMRVGVDFREEQGSPEENAFEVREILYIEDDDDVSPDIAFLRAASAGEDGQELPPPVPLSALDPRPDQTIGIIGYAIRDGGRNDDGVIEHVFQHTYDVKRLHPGEVTEVGERLFSHDCSTLVGNSGSPVIDFHTGEVVGIHFAGSFELENYAVKASIIHRRMAELGIGQESTIGGAAYGSRRAALGESDDRDAEIEALYRRIDTLTQAKSEGGDAGVEGEIAEALAQLRKLQRTEAARFREEFEARLAMPVDAGKKILGRARALREKLERLTSPDPSSD